MTKIEQEQEISDHSKSFEDFLTWHFIKEKDFSKILKSRFQGFYEDYADF